MKLADITDLSSMPKLTDPEHRDVKMILMMYSLESFLFKRLNQGSREKDQSVVNTLGPFAVALTKIINNIQRERTDKMNGPFVCYSGIALTESVI